jgi:hypothetical protein
MDNAQGKDKPLELHPVNPHYFLFKGKPTVLITSGEHYGSVLNLDFNYIKYLDTLQADKLNNTRLFTGAYVEPAGAFNIERNTLAPGPERYLAPWARSATPGYANRGNKFDLTKWDPAYFKRLKDFVGQASRHGIVVEVNLFCPFYEESQWNLSPQNSLNNVNNLGTVYRTNVYTLDNHGGLLAIHEALTRKIVTELKDSDNVYYEICNEPYFGGVTLDWQHRIAEVIVETEKPFKFKHLISQNIANEKAKVNAPDPLVSIFNFHYASPPDTVPLNYSLNKVIGDNETGFKGTNNTHYRIEGWEFIMAGGGLYNNLDYSFAPGYEDGTFGYTRATPGGGNAELRKQLRFLSEFIHSFNFTAMKPANSLIKGGVPAGAKARVLAEKDTAWAVYINGGSKANLKLDLLPGQYRVEWINTKTGGLERKEILNHASGPAVLTSPDYSEDIALRVIATKKPRPDTKAIQSGQKPSNALKIGQKPGKGAAPMKPDNERQPSKPLSGRMNNP